MPTQVNIKEVLERMTLIFHDVFDDDQLQICEKTSAHDIAGWDSLAHIRLVGAIEKSFVLKFSAAEVSSLENVGQMAELIALRLAAE